MYFFYLFLEHRGHEVTRFSVFQVICIKRLGIVFRQLDGFCHGKDLKPLISRASYDPSSHLEDSLMKRKHISDLVICEVP